MIQEETAGKKEGTPPYPVAVKRPPPIKHAFLKKIILVLLALAVNIIVLGVIIGSIVLFVYMFFQPSPSDWAYVTRQVLLLLGLGIFVGPVFLGRMVIGTDDGLGIPVDQKEQPALFGIMTEAATAVGTYPVRHVTFRPEAGLSIDLGSSWFSLSRRRPRLFIGLPTLIGLTTHEFKTALAHEHAHLRFGRGWSGLFIRSGMVLISCVFSGFTGNRVAGVTRFINPIYWLFWIIALLIGPWSEEMMKWDEYQADIASGRIYGYKAAVESQRKGLVNVFVFEIAVEKAKRWLMEKNMRVDDIVTYIERIRNSMGDADVQQILARTEVLVGRFDSAHPSPAARAEAVEEFECKINVDESPAMDVISNLDELRGKLTDKFYGALAKIREINLDAAETVPAEELGLSYTAAEIDTILEKFISEAGEKGLSLAYDRESLERADRHFAAHPEFFKGPPDKDVLGDLILYFGETIRRLHGGEWVFPIVAPPRLKEVGPNKLNLEVYEIFLSELAAANYPTVMPAFIRSLDRLGIKDEPATWGRSGGRGTVV